MTALEHLDDPGLVQRARAGGQEAYGEIVRRFERPLYGLILRMVRDPSTAEDLAQDAFLKAFSALDSYDPRRKLSSWLFKIAHNTTIDHLRRKQPVTVSLTPPEGEGEPDYSAGLADAGAEDAERSVERADLAAALEAAMGDLRPEYREVLVLRFQEGLAYNEIAEVTGLALGTVKTHLHRARKELAALMAGSDWAPESETARGGSS